jgi:exopolysaccharide biosynthesis protein
MKAAASGKQSLQRTPRTPALPVALSGIFNFSARTGKGFGCKVSYCGGGTMRISKLKIKYFTLQLIILFIATFQAIDSAIAQSSSITTTPAESRTQATLAPGVTLTTITRGTASKEDHWTLSILMPASGDSLSMLSSRDQAERIVARLVEAGFKAELREERNPEYKDLPAGTLGYSVRVGAYAGRDDAKADMTGLSGLGYKTMLLFTGEDNAPTSGPWAIRVLTVDPRAFRGEIMATHGASIAGRNTVSVLAQQSGALAAVNAGFFAMLPSEGVPGEPAGLFVDHGKVLSEATNGRITMDVFNRNTPKGDTFVRFQELTTTMNLIVDKALVRPVEGINRKPGVIRNCGGKGDIPTELPRHDATCTDADEIVVITPEFGAPAPSGDGVEAVVDKSGDVIELRARGGAIPAEGMLVQGIGSEAAWLTSNLHAGTRVRFEVGVNDVQGKPVAFDSNDFAVNGGPGLVEGGRPEIRPVADGLVRSDDPAFFLRWGVRRNPRTMAGVDSQNRILLVTVDGHLPGKSLGLSLVEGAQLMIGLGAVNAMNLDGGGSTAMVVNGKLISSPSDPAGERAVGDAIILK